MVISRSYNGSSARRCCRTASCYTTASSTCAGRSRSFTGSIAEPSSTRSYWRAPGWRSRDLSISQSISRLACMVDGHDGCGTLYDRLAAVSCQASHWSALHALDHHSHLCCQLPCQRSALLRERCPVDSVSSPQYGCCLPTLHHCGSFHHLRLPFKVIQVIPSSLKPVYRLSVACQSQVRSDTESSSSSFAWDACLF